ncbi:hypothetical protein LUZ60_002918 [Juncus effusus]|nr:hypothetical protein LUZ60_002918 [Juncus effusus]
MHANQQTPSQPSSSKPPTLHHCIALLQTCLKSLATLKQIHSHALRTWVPISHPLFAKHLIFSLISLSPTPLKYAHSVFSQVKHPNVFTFNTMIRAYAESLHPGPALEMYSKMLCGSVSPDTHTYPFVLKACAKVMSLKYGESVHGQSIRNGFEKLVFVKNALIHFYSACGFFNSAYKVFDEMCDKNLVAWNSILNGFACNGKANEVLCLFREMSKENEITGRVKPDGFTMVSLLTACAELHALELGQRIHVYLYKTGLKNNSHVLNALIDLYSKCGWLNHAHKVFDEMGLYRNTVSYTTLIVGLATNGFGKEALNLFFQMEEREKLIPSDITMIGVLHACSHCGLVEQGFHYFNKMINKYNIKPRMEHFGCMVDLLGRSGRVEEAYDYILNMGGKPNAVMWRTLLGACVMWKKLDLGLTAWARLVELDPGHDGDFVLLSNLYASVGKWKEVYKIRQKMVKKRVVKRAGVTC